MAKIKQLVPDDIELAHSEPFFYPGEPTLTPEEEDEAMNAMRLWRLHEYTTEELYDEINRRALEPLNKAVAELKALTDKHFPATTDLTEQPF